MENELTKKQFAKIVGENIARIRSDSDPFLSQEKLAELVGISRTYMGKIERGEKNISFYAMCKLLKVLNLDASKFIDDI